MKLNIKAYSLAFGLFWGMIIFSFTWWLILFDGPYRGKTFLGSVYRGYHRTPAGSLIGLAWGFLDGCLWGALFAGIYNRLEDRFGGRQREEREERDRHREHHHHEHAPWLYALVHRVPGIHA